MHGKEAKPLSEVISKVLREMKFRNRSRVAGLRDVWREAVGPEISPHTRLGGFRNGVLFIEVDSSGRLQELSSFYKDEILQKLRQKARGLYIAELKFTLTQRGSAGNEKGA